jgi:[acyl-carrier-protein] S-malonyltransferase
MVEATEVAYVFPGQGSQLVGMGRDLYENFASSRAVFRQADEVLGFPLSRLCFEGPEDELRLTLNAQPAILTASYACLEAAREANSGLPEPHFMAGHSLGEYTALAVSGVFDFKTAVYLARERGRMMHEADTVRPGSMAAIIGLEEAVLLEVCQQTCTCIANMNSPAQLVIGGDADAVSQAMELARDRGAARVIPLPVSAAFHTPLMQPVIESMADIISRLAFADPAIPVIANITACPLTTAQAVKEELVQQLSHCVQWQRSVEYMVEQGVKTFLEIGPGKVLSGLIKRINRDVRTVNIGDAQAVSNSLS